MDDVYRLIKTVLEADDAIRALIKHVGIEGEERDAALPAITYLLMPGPAEQVLERPALKVDLWSEKDNPQPLQVLADRIDAVMRERFFRTDAGRRVIMDRELTWADVPDPDARHRTSLWSLITI